jgi:hypothetical protein
MALLLDEGTAQDLLRIKGKLRVKCGPCMEPTFRKGEIAIIVPSPRIVAGMVVLIHSGRGYVLHRLLKVIPPWGIHGGDGTSHPGICRLREIIGIATEHSIEVSSGSMEPTIPTGSRIPVQQGVAKKGDVALFWGETHPQVHRILGSSGNWIIHAGDGSATPGIAAKRDIVGIVPATLPPTLPAARKAHALELLLRMGTILYRLGIPNVGLLRIGTRLIKKLLLAPFLRR